MGFKFLKHIERTKVLIHVVDVSGSEGRNPIDDFNKINKELEAYSPRILKKPQLVAANKIDMIDEDESTVFGIQKVCGRAGLSSLSDVRAAESGCS